MQDLVDLFDIGLLRFLLNVLLWVVLGLFMEVFCLTLVYFKTFEDKNDSIHIVYNCYVFYLNDLTSYFFYTQFSYILLIYGMTSNLFLRNLTIEINSL